MNNNRSSLATCSTDTVQRGALEVAISVESSYQNASLALRCIRSVAQLGFDDVQAQIVEQCMGEAINNVIEHAYQEEGNHPVEVRMRLLDDYLEMTVSDNGRSMSPDMLEKPIAVLEFDPSDLDSIPEGGMGLELMRMNMDDVSYKTEDGWNHLTLTRNRPGHA